MNAQSVGATAGVRDAAAHVLRQARFRSLRESVRRAPPLETAIFVVALALLAAVTVYRSHAMPTRLPASFSSYDAAGGGYRVFYELLVAQRVRVDRFEQRPAFLDADIDTLVWADPAPFDTRANPPTRADVAALASWVRGGGRLLYLADGNANAAGAGARSWATQLALPPIRAARSYAGHRFVAPVLSASGVVRLGAPPALRWRLPRRGVSVLIDGGRGATLVRYTLGRGSVTAALDEDAFTNMGIARGDNARLAVALATPRRRGAYVSFDEAPHGFITPEHWWQIVPRLFMIALALAAFALALALAGAGIRLGPPLSAPDDAGTPPNFLDALATLLNRGRAYGYAMAAARASTVCAVARAAGLAAETAPEDVLASVTPADAAAFAQLLDGRMQPACDERTFVRHVGLMQRLRKGYAGNAGIRY